MKTQWKTWSVIGVGAVLMSVGCGPSDQSQAAQSQRQTATTFCGGVGNRQCPDGLLCVDDPDDDCNPKNGDADCGGICVTSDETAQSTCGHEPGYDYILRDPAKCATVRFTCPTGQAPFFNDCGCGCRPAS